MKTMTEYQWDEQFYKELVIDYNYRFPKFMEISYPIQKEESINECLKDSTQTRCDDGDFFTK